MIAFITPYKAQIQIAAQMRAQRVQIRLTQEGLAQKAAVPLATLRKFERTGLISLEAFLKMAMVVGVLEKIVEAVESEQRYASIDDVVKDNKAEARKDKSVKSRVRI